MKFEKGIIWLHGNKKRNIITYDGTDYLLEPLNPAKPISKGGNSNVYKAISQNSGVEYAIKICRFNEVPNNYSRILRFNKEIEALEISQNNNFQYVVNIEFHDYLQIDGLTFHYYIMEKADGDLTNYLENNKISEQQRFYLCTQILEGIKELHSQELYHRDIKPDNILMSGDSLKIGDLGLVEYRNSNFKIDETGERIGPIGWMSPEAMNKFYNEGKSNRFKLDCTLDNQSDIFQLGKLFWFIFQGNIPIGQILKEDFYSKNEVIYEIIFNMIRHSKGKRITLNDVENGFQTQYKNYGL